MYIKCFFLYDVFYKHTMYARCYGLLTVSRFSHFLPPLYHLSKEGYLGLVQDERGVGGIFRLQEDFTVRQENHGFEGTLLTLDRNHSNGTVKNRCVR